MLNLKNVKKILDSLSLDLQADNVEQWPKTENGPYSDPETPLRVLSHLLKINSYLYQSTGENKYEARAKGLFSLAKIITDDFAVLVFRNKEGKDSSNGLIGPAWLLEGLIHANKNFGDDVYLNAAKKVYSQFHFDEQHRVWSFPEKGEYILDPTFNHQLWFATQGLKLGCKNSISFLENFIPRIKINKGVIFHLTPLRTDASIEGLRQYIRFLKYKNSLNEKSVAYNAFNLLALSECYLVDKSLNVWSNNNFKKLLKLDINSQYFDVLKKSKYGLSYNPQAPAYITFGKLFQDKIKNDYLKQHKVSFSKLLTHEINPSDNLLKIRNYEYITLLEILDV
ncbi:hypothetical protein [Pseudoalteromonas atlantica]|uniref:hypothetical protein n=1 Tax=Pseudoalteromonas atlantica TaxID=288 RepID=UPI003735956A